MTCAGLGRLSATPRLASGARRERVVGDIAATTPVDGLGREGRYLLVLAILSTSACG
jgi:hypothetical protein